MLFPPFGSCSYSIKGYSGGHTPNQGVPTRGTLLLFGFYFLDKVYFNILNLDDFLQQPFLGDDNFSSCTLDERFDQYFRGNIIQ